jgi:hypothetical protein
MASRLVRTALAVAAVLVAAEALGHLLDFGVWGLRIQALNADAENGMGPWIASLAIFVAAGAATVRALGARRRDFAALAAILGFLAIGGRLDLRSSVPHWMLLYAPLLAAAAVLVWRLVPEPIARIGLAALALSLVIHVAGPPLLARLGWGPASWAYQVKIAIKEGTELAGWTLVAAALLSGLRVRRARLTPALDG